MSMRDKTPTDLQAAASSSEESWELIHHQQVSSSDGSSKRQDAMSHSSSSKSCHSSSFVVLSDPRSHEYSKPSSGPETTSDYSIISEDTNRTETDQIKKDLSYAKLQMLAKIETKFKHEIRGFDRTEICTICQYTYNECSSRLVHLKCGHYYHERCFVLGVATDAMIDWKCLICRADAITGLSEKVEEPSVKDPFGKYRGVKIMVRCSKCNMAFSKGRQFDEHLKLTKHHNGRKYACRICKSVYMTHHELMSHVFAVGHNRAPETYRGY